MSSYTYHANRNKGLCGMCGEVETVTSQCADCTAIARIKREARGDRACPRCACGRHRIQMMSDCDRCWECRMELGFYAARRPVRVRTDEMRQVQRDRTRVWRAKVRAEKALRRPQPLLRALFNPFAKRGSGVHI